ncbi:hypothetical protein ACHAXR_008550 [Thalassiosira sp. AJA248-18]
MGDLAAKRKWYLYALSFLTISLCGGLVYGWPALRRNLRDNGSTLSEQQLGGIFTVGAWSTQGGRFFFGLVRDQYGTRRTALASTLCVVAGAVGIAFSDPNSVAQLGVSMFLIGLGSAAQLCLQPVAGLFVKAGTIMASLSGAFQVSGLVFFALTSITHVRSHSFGALAIIIAALSVALAKTLPLGSSFVLPAKPLPARSSAAETELPGAEFRTDDADEETAKSEHTPAGEVTPVPLKKESSLAVSFVLPAKPPPARSSTAETELPGTKFRTDDADEEAAKSECTPAGEITPVQLKKESSLANLTRRSRELLFISEYIALLMWFSVCVIPLQYYVGSIGFQLEGKGDNEGFYTNLFSILYASAAGLAPFGGYIADTLGLGIAQGIATGLSAVSFFVLASEASLNVQAVGLAAYGTGRVLVYGTYFSNIGKRLGYANYGLLAGLGLIISAIVSLVQYPLIALAADGKARQVNITCGAALIGALPYCIWLGLRERRGHSPINHT